MSRFLRNSSRIFEKFKSKSIVPENYLFEHRVICIQFELVSTRKYDDFDLAKYLERSMKVIVSIDDRLDGLTMHNLPTDSDYNSLELACIKPLSTHRRL